MARKKGNLKSSPAVEFGIGTALNPIGLSQSGPLFIDIEVAAEHYRNNSEFISWCNNKEAQAIFGTPVRPRTYGNGSSP